MMCFIVRKTTSKLERVILTTLYFAYAETPDKSIPPGKRMTFQSGQHPYSPYAHTQNERTNQKVETVVEIMLDPRFGEYRERRAGGQPTDGCNDLCKKL
jgi:hypothetical protein